MAFKLASSRAGTVTYTAFVALSAYFGAIGMISGLLPVPASLASRLPLHSPVFAGIALSVVVALPSTAVAVLAWRRRPHVHVAAALAGVLLVGWIAVEAAIVRQFSPLQVVYGVAGIGLIVFFGASCAGSVRH